MSDKNLFTHIKENWIVYAFILQLVANYALNNADHLQFKKDISELQTYRQSESILLTDIQSRLVGIETSIKYIERAIK